jgi:hypothetical protein
MSTVFETAILLSKLENEMTPGEVVPAPRAYRAKLLNHLKGTGTL